ncbi:MAG: D-alanine--D-alanine ligase [Trueperaceae bacterium]
MTIAILQSNYDKSDSPQGEYDLPCDPSVYLPEHPCETYLLDKANAVQKTTELVHKGFDVFINLCDGAADENRAGIEVVQTLEKLGAAFTGAASNFYEPTREEMKAACAAQGVKYPAFVMAKTDEDIHCAAQTLRFPLIAKHPNSYGSVGLRKSSRVTHADDLRVEARHFIDMYGASLIEEFIEGQEYTVLVAENPDDATKPIAYTPMQFHFPDGETFKHFALKWIDYKGMSSTLVTDSDLSEKLKDAGRKIFVGLDGSSFGRCDMRVDAKGDVYVLEINPNCGIFYPEAEPGSADYILLNDPKGHRGFLEIILRAALKKVEGKKLSWV